MDNADGRKTESKKGFARRHPALTTIGVVGIGLVAGIELAAGLVIGAGITALAYRFGSKANDTATNGAH